VLRKLEIERKKQQKAREETGEKISPLLDPAVVSELVVGVL